MINGNIDTGIDSTDLLNLKFEDYFQTYQQLPEIAKYYTAANSSIWQMFDVESPKWVHALANKLPQDFENHVVSVIRIDPGQTIPFHADKHYWLQEKFGAGDTWRYLVFLEDWKSGHYFEIHTTPIIKWRAGDYIKFHRNDWHIAGNMGIEPFYSAQITVK